MNKMIKGSVAGATGIALLMGGFGTYALWSQTVPANGGIMQAGGLRVLSTGNGTWEETSTGTSQNWNNATDRMVPQDVVVLHQPLDVEALGKNLLATLTISGVDNTFAANSLTVNVQYGGENVNFSGKGPYVLNYDTATKIQALNADNDGAVVTFRFNDVAGTTDQDQTIDLSKVNLTLQQVRPTA